MAVETKTNAGGKPRQKRNINWTQVGVVAFCILIVVMCILSFSNLSNIFNQNGNSTTGVVEAGNAVEIEYTMYIGTTPMVTSSLEVFQAANVSNLPIATEPIGLFAGQQTDVINGSAILINSSYEYPFRMLNQEFNLISSGVVGLGIGQSRTVEGPGSFFQTIYTKDQADEMGIDFANWTVGTMGLMNFPTDGVNNTTTMAVRSALVTNKTDAQMTLQYGYDTIEMKVTQAYKTNA